MLADLDAYLAHAERQIDQIRRRVLRGETIPHGKKVFSIFQSHTKWISKMSVYSTGYRFLRNRTIKKMSNSDQFLA